MDYESFFRDGLAALRREGNYRVFADLERKAGDYPRARHHHASGPRDVTVWCSNDYLGMGQHPAVRAAMIETIEVMRGGRRGHAQHLGHEPPPRAAGAGACRAARQGGGAAVHLGLCLELRRARHARRAAAGLRHPVGRAEPRQHDRGHPAQPRGKAHLAAQRRGGPRPPARPGRAGAAEADRLRVGLFHGRRCRAHRRDLRRRREARRDDLSRRGARRGHVRAARRRHRGSRGADGPPDGHRGHAGQGLRHDGRLYRRLGGALRLSCAASRAASSSRRPCRRRWRPAR